MSTLRIGRQITASLDRASEREWLVADGRGGFAMGTASGLQTRRYHGLLITATQPPGGRRLGLSSLAPNVGRLITSIDIIKNHFVFLV